MEEGLAEAMLKANDIALAPDTSADLTEEEKARLQSVKGCSLGDSVVMSKGNATHVSVGFFLINFDHRRSEQKKSSAKGQPAYFLLDFLISVSQPQGSKLWANDTEVWDTLSFRNAKEIYASETLPGDARTRRVKAAFFYDPDLSMYPIDSQRLEVRLQQTKHSTAEWVFVPSRELNGLNTQLPDIEHKPCAGHMFAEPMHGKEYSNYAFTIQVRKPRWFAVITGFFPPLLMLLPVVLGHTLGPMSWYPKRFMLSGVAWVTLAFFYVSYLRNLPMLAYLTAFDKYMYCLYMWLFGTIVSLAMLVRTFRFATEDLEAARESRDEEEKLFLSRHLRDDLLHFSMFASFTWWMVLLLLNVLWVWVFPTLRLTIAVCMLVFFAWLYLSYGRLHKKHARLQHESTGWARTPSSYQAERLDVQKSAGRSFNWRLYWMFHKPFRILCLEECCCCFYSSRGSDSFDEDHYEEEEECWCCFPGIAGDGHVPAHSDSGHLSGISGEAHVSRSASTHAHADSATPRSSAPSALNSNAPSPAAVSTMEEGGMCGGQSLRRSLRVQQQLVGGLEEAKVQAAAPGPDSLCEGEEGVELREFVDLDLGWGLKERRAQELAWQS